MKKTKSITLQLLFYHIIGAAVLGAFLFLLHFFADDSMQKLFSRLEAHDFSYMGVLDSQIAVTFIVISIVTVFAQRNVMVYWEDVVKYKMISPRFSNFSAMSSYIFVNLIASILLIFLGSGYVYVTFFVAIGLIMVLSLKMIAAFFSGDMMKLELQRHFAAEKKARLTNSVMRERYREHKRKLIQYTIQALDDNDIDTVCENMKFLYQFEENEDAFYLLQKMVRDNKSYTLSRVAKVCREIFAEDAQTEVYLEICRDLKRSGSPDDAGYIKSICKSIRECAAAELLNRIEGQLEELEEG